MTNERNSVRRATQQAGERRSPWWRRGGRYLLVERPALLLTPLVFVLVLVIAELITRANLVSPVILPSPGAVASALWTLVTAAYFPENLLTTALEAVLGFAIAAVAAVTIAIVMDQIRLFREVFYPYAVLFQVVPSIVLAPIFVIWFGFGTTSKVVVAVITAFFVILVNTLAGLRSVPENSELLMSSLVASRFQRLVKLKLPTALPFMFAGFKLASTLGLIGALVGEFITARVGLGKLLTTFSFALKQDMVFATVVIVGLLGVVLYGAVALVEKRVLWWR